MKRNNGLDLLKAICAFMVVCIHAPFSGIAGEITVPLTRVAVPIFFMVTGYYYSFTKERKSEKKQLIKILRLFVGANLLYFVWSLAKTCLSHESVTAYLGNAFSLQSILNFILLNNSPFGGHLWYLGAITYVLLIVLLFEKKWSRQKLYPLIPVLLLIDIVFGKYALLLFGREFPIVLVRNFACVGLPYFLIGEMLFTRKTKIKPNKTLILILVFALTTLAERFALGAFGVNAQRDHYISTTFLAITIFLLAVQHEGAFKSRVLQLLCYAGAKLSTGIYIVNPIFIPVLAKAVAFVSRYVPANTVYGYIEPFAVFLGAAIAVWVWQRMTQKRKG